MKNLRIKYYQALLLFSCLYFFPIQNLIAQPAPIVTGLSPVAASVGSSVVISGSNFGAIPSGNTVWFGGLKATVTAASPTSLTVTVPPGASNPVRVYTGGLEGQSPIPFVLTFLGTSSLSAASFNTLVPSQAVGIQNGGNAGLPNNSIANLKFADLDGDGKPDLICGRLGTYVQFNTSTPGTISQGTISGPGVINASFEARNAGGLIQGMFSELTTYGTNAAQEGDIDFGDIDGDGLIDIVSSVYRPGNVDRVSIFRNVSGAPGSLSSSNFASPIVYGTGGRWARNVRLADFDGDGKLDILTDGDGSGGSIFRNTSSPGSISFSAIADLSAGINNYFIEMADIDRDGKLDIVARSYGGSQVVVLRNTSSGIGNISFAPAQAFNVVSGGVGLKLGDIDGDGMVDVLATGSTGKLSILRNTSTSGAVNFDPYYTISGSTSLNVADAAIGDLDGDSKVDIAFNDANYTMYVVKNNSTPGNLSFGGDIALNPSNTLAQYASEVVIQDVDGDGKNDIASLSTYTNGINFFSNALTVLPVTWIDFTARSQANGIQLRWSTAAEQQNLYFEVGRSSDGKTFSDIGRVPAAQHSDLSQTYNWLDSSRIFGKVFYRIRQVDYDQKFNYSKTVALNLENNLSTWISPNPITGLLHIELAARLNGSGELRIFNMQGQLMLRRPVNGATMYLDCSNWSAGMYVLNLYDRDQRVFSKIFEKR